MPRRESSRVQSIRLGGLDEAGKRHTVASLEACGGIAEQEAEDVPFVDWQGIAFKFCFDRRERLVWFGHYRDQCERSALGLTAQQLGAVKREIERKLKANPATTRTLAVRIPESQIILEKSLATSRNQQFLGGYVRSQILKLETMQQNLTDAKQKLSRLTDVAGTAQAAVIKLQRAADKIETDAKKNEAEAIFSETPIVAGPNEKLNAALVKVAAAESTLTAARTACARQQQVVSDVEAQIEENRRESFSIELEPHKANVMRLIRELVEAAPDLRLVAHKHGFIDGHVLCDELFPISGPNFSSVAINNRDFCVGVINAAIGFRDRMAANYEPGYWRL